MSVSDVNRKPRKVDVAYQQLRRMIVTLELEPGAPIDERELIARLDIGRTPVREAIQRLIHEGMISHTPRRGSWVSPLSFTELQFVIESRRMLEVECARRAAQRITPSMSRELRELVRATGDRISAGDAQESVVVDQELHLGIARATSNRYLIRMTEQLQHELIRYWYVSAVQVGDLHEIVRHHHVILDALETRNPERAVQAMEDHMTLFRERLGALVSGGEPPIADALVERERDC